MVHELSQRMCGRDYKPVLRHPRMVCIPFATNQNLSVFCANTKRTGCSGCPFHAPDVLCLPQVRGKLINHVQLTPRMRMVQHIRGALLYTKLKASYTQARWMVCEPNAQMGGPDCKPALRHMRMVCMLLAANQNLSFFARTQRELDAPSVLSMHRVSFARLRFVEN